jgi:hypothetical protein
MKRVFVCSPYRGNTAKNVEIAQAYCRVLLMAGFAPFAPHLYLPGVMEDEADDDERKRELGIQCGLAWLRACDFVVAAASSMRDTAVTEGMCQELEYARDRLKLSVIWQRTPEDLKEVLEAAARLRKLKPRGHYRSPLGTIIGYVEAVDMQHAGR